MTAPSAISSVYSELNLKLTLATEGNAQPTCTGAMCDLDRTFDNRVLQLGNALANEAFKAYPDLSKRFDKFQFVIVDKVNPGSLSNSSGKVVIFRGIQKLLLGDEELSFLIAREMGHVIALHHDENSATTIMFSMMAAALVPISNLISGSAVLVQTGSTSVQSTLTASVASLIGSKVTIANYAPEQLHEADAIAINLLGRCGWNRNDIADALIARTRVMGDDSWSSNLRVSTEDVILLAEAHNSITKLNIETNATGKTVVSVGLAQMPVNLPVIFTTNNPPRIILDFINTKSNLVKQVQNHNEGDLLSTHIVQVEGRTRLMINLNRIPSYATRIDGNNLLITMQSISTDTAPKNTFRIADANLPVRQ